MKVFWNIWLEVVSICLWGTILVGVSKEEALWGGSMDESFVGDHMGEYFVEIQ